jgi:hypothetical protein
MSKNLKEIMVKEYIRCSQDPIHFMRKYCFIQHPQRGRMLFNLFPFQEGVLKLFQQNDYCIINKSRQLGISTLVAGYSLWLMQFQKDKNILCIATKQETAKNMVTKVKFMYENLPSWLKVVASENNKLNLRLSNGSQIKATSAASDAGRSEAVSLLLIDEAAFIDGIDKIWASAQQTLATGGGCIALSTPYGTGNWFHKTYTSAEEKSSDNKFLPIRLPWDVHPERDQKWRDVQDELLGDPRIAAQECDAEFNTSGDIVFYPEWLDFMENTTIKDPIERRGIDQNLWVWESPDYSRDYMVVADVARGDGKDFSTAHIVEIETNTQVAEYKGQMPPKDFGFFLVGLATEYNNALLVVENSNVGWATLDAILEREYSNLYYSTRSEKLTAESYLKAYESSSDLVPGFTTSLKTRPLLLNKFREFVGEHSIDIRSRRLLEEMKVFIWKNGRAEAQSGYNDDLIMAMAIGMYLRDTSLRFQQKNMDMAKASLSSMQRQTQNFASGGYSNKVQNPYSMDIGKNKENLNWLL